MTVYVDRAQIAAKVGRHDARWSHLTADTEDELHEFAARLGLRRSYFQPGKPVGGRPSVAWHYDVTEGKRRQALGMGAQEIELDQWREILGHRRSAQTEAACAEPGPAAAAATKTPADLTRIPALTVWQPWAWAIATRGKAVENRPWRTDYRGPLAIHAGRTYDAGAQMPGQAGQRLRALEAECLAAGGRTREARHLAPGVVLAVAELTGCHQDRPGACCSEWAAPGQWHWQLEDVQLLRQPVPCRGARQMWAMPAQVADAVQGQLRAGRIVAAGTGDARSPASLLLVTGPREVTDASAVAEILRPRFSPDITLLAGGARGVDTIAARLWREWGGQVEEDRVSPAEWAQSRAAGFVRNARMVAKVKASGGEVVLALEAPCADARCSRREPHNTHGTSDCADRAAREGLKVDREPIAGVRASRAAAETDPPSREAGAAEPDAGRTLADFASERARSAWQAGDLVQAARLNHRCISLDPGRGEKWRARAEQIRAEADRAELGVTLAVRLALAGIEPDDPALVRAAEHNRRLGIPQTAPGPGGRDPEAGE